MSAAVEQSGAARGEERDASPPHAPFARAQMDAARVHRTNVVEFFDREDGYRWWENVYDPSYPRGFFSHEMARRRHLVLALLRRHAPIHRETRVLECGCGPGGMLHAIAAAGCRTVGIDLNPRLLTAAARREAARSTWVQADIESLPFSDGAFDVVLCVGVLSYLRKDERAIAELARVARPGGTVAIALPNRLPAGRVLDPFYYLVWAPSRMVRALASAFGRGHRSAARFHSGLIRRYARHALDGAYRRAGLTQRDTASVSFGPATFWRKEILPLAWSIAMSDWLSGLSSRRSFAFLGRLSNHWVTLLTKRSSAPQRGDVP